ncbi:efflux RND transporter permease subunit [Zhaonella formicivorans]|uniref:efflux RND transporter permease subunit n=1 Tax=Zhaonella formicivorans TaxID=2528593 RepID=UPI001D125C21|nr:efflux RND transporter permease subunit [Zhaonella formicivorans]
MRLSDFSVNRPVTVLMCVLVVLILGVVSLTNLNVDLFPELNFPVAMVMANYEGAGPQEVENLVTKPLESVLGTVNNVKNIQSHSLVGQAIIVLEFEWGTDMDFATLQMREKVDLVKRWLPAEVEQPTVFKMDPNLMPIMQFAMTGDMPMADLKKLAEDKIVSRLERLPGVAAAQISGGREREIQVKLDPVKLDYYGITFTQVAQALQMDNMNMSGGKVGKGNQDLLVRVTGEFQSAGDVGEVMLATPQGAQVRVKDIGQVIDGYKELSVIGRTDGKESITFNIRKQTTANTVKVSQAVNKALAELRKQLPDNVKLVTIWDSAEFIQTSINNVVDNIIIGGILAVVVLFLFLRNMRSTLIIGISMPISIIATFILMYFGHLTLNIMSLGGLALGVGMMVDNSIVILENIFRHREEGLDRIEASKFGASEVANAIIASTLTTIAVFFPIVFVEGIAAQIFKQLALTISFSLIASLLVALTLIPMLSSKMLAVTPVNEGIHKSKGQALYYKMFTRTGAWLNALDNAYRRLLHWALTHRRRVVVIVTLLVLASIGLAPLVGAEFIPAMDQGYISIDVTLPYGSKLEETEKVVSRIEQILNKIPEVKVVASSVGSASGDLGGLSIGNPENGKIDLALKSWKERTRSTQEVADQIRHEIKDIAGAEITVTVGDSASSMGFSTSPVEVVIKGDDLKVLNDLASQVKGVLEGIEGTREVQSSMEEGRPEVQVVIDRQKAAAYGLNAAQVAGATRGAVQGQVVTRYRTDGDEIDIRVMLPEEKRRNLQDLSSLTVAGATGVQVPLSEVAELKILKGPNTIERRNQVRTVVVTSQIAGRDLNSITKEAQEKINSLAFPPGYEVEFGGAAKQMAESFGDLTLALVLAIVLVYMVMAAQFESLFHPFVIMFSMPVTIIGVVLGLLVTGRTFSVVAFVGVIMLAGIVVNNAIVLIDYINVLRRRGMERTEAILKAGPTRLRPILMTTLTTVLGMLPLAMGIGEGGEARAPMGVVVIGGLMTSTLLTLIFVPVVYSIFDDWGKKLAGRRKKGVEVSKTGPVVEG